MELYTIAQIRELYLQDYLLGLETQEFDKYFHNNFTPVYDDKLNFLGYNYER